MARAPVSAIASFGNPARETFFESLSASQRKAVALVVHAARNDLATMTSVCHYAQDAGIISEPSCRRIIQRLRGLKLIDCGSSKSKGKILMLTPLGEKILLGESILCKLE